MKTILVIDDEVHALKLLRYNLEEVYHVRTAQSVHEAKEIMKEFIPNAIISDINMPGEDGLTFSCELAQTHPHVPVIIMTAYGDKEKAIMALKNRVFDFLEKPFESDELLISMEKAVALNALYLENEQLQELLKKNAIDQMRITNKFIKKLKF